MTELTLPLGDDAVRSLHCGDPVLLSGIILTARDAAHKWIIETFIQKSRPEHADDAECHLQLQHLLDGSVIYHCGPVVAGLDTRDYRFVAAGPTTSIREEPYQADVIKHFKVKGVLGKGGMGTRTLKACQEAPAVYLHAIGGAASFLAECVTKVVGVMRLEFGVPEAIWIIQVSKFPAVVTMDSHGESLHEQVERDSRQKLQELLARR
jgi:fumarate hydratase class I